ncbi:MAG TPA: transglutaminase-like domain-containing protein [Humibacter sp.]|nr:transglutaminase-like domain-containing protein [Humibacter sp.]
MTTTALRPPGATKSGGGSLGTGAGWRGGDRRGGDRRGGGFGGLSTTTWTDVGVLMGLSVLAVVGFEPAFGHYAFVPAALGGLIVGGGAALVGRLFRLSVPVTVLIALAAYFVLGTPLALPSQATLAVLPSIESLAGLVLGAVFGWSDAVTLQAPLEAPPYVAVIPYVATWLVGLVTVSLASRWLAGTRRTTLRSGALLIAPVLLFLAGILLGTRDPYFAAVRGVLFAAVALVWLGWRRGRDAAVVVQGDKGLRTRKLVGSAIVVVGAVVVGALVGGVVAPAQASRFVLRQEVTPPFDPLDYPSPLAGFRHYTKDLQKTKLFTITGAREGDLVRLATMDSYDGIVWSVTDPEQQTDGSGGFELLGSTIPRPPLFTPGSDSKATLTVDGYNDVWLPNLGYVNSLHFDKYTGTDPTTTVRVNRATGTTAVTSGVKRGLEYTITVTAQKLPSDKQLARVAPATLEMPPVSNVPDIVASKAEEFAGHSSSAIQKLRNIERSFKSLGYLSHGRASDPVPSRAGEGADRMTDLLTKEPMVGDQEQYASAFALMARHLGYPARVVMGFAPKARAGSATAAVTGDDVTAWAEVAFDRVGWVPFFPTPTKTDAPKDQTTKPKLQPQPQVRQPPRSNPKAEDLLTPVKTKDNNPKDKKSAFELPGWVYWVAGIIGIPLLAYFLPLLIIAGLKRRRRRRRRTTGPPHRQSAGAWDELTDGYAELGFTIPAKATRKQTAEALRAQLEQQGLPQPANGFDTLANQVDAAVFDGSHVSDERVETTWAAADAAVEQATRSAGWLRARIASFRFHRAEKRGGIRPRRTTGSAGVPRAVDVPPAADPA